MSAQREGQGVDDHAQSLPEQPARYGVVDGKLTAFGRVKGGQNIYGFTVGVLMLDTRFPRIPGDMGNATTFPFPVRYHRVNGAAPDLVVRRGAEACSKVCRRRPQWSEGVGAITTNCGFLVKFQRQMAAAVRVPVFTSSLLLVPFVHRLLAPGRRVGIMTVNAPSLTPEHLVGAGIGSDIPLAVVGMETEKEFTRVLLATSSSSTRGGARRTVQVRGASSPASRHRRDRPGVTNMPPYADDIRRETGLPVSTSPRCAMAHDALARALPRPPERRLHGSQGSRKVVFPANTTHRGDIRRQALQHPDRDPVVPGAPLPAEAQGRDARQYHAVQVLRAKTTTAKRARRA